MKTAYLNGWEIDSKPALHDALAAQLGFPAWYGRNLDALYDLLTAAPEEYRIEIRSPEALEARLGGYYRLFLRVLEDIRDEGGPVSFTTEPPPQRVSEDDFPPYSPDSDW